MIISLILAMAMFAGVRFVYVDYRHAPQDTLDVYVIGNSGCGRPAPNGMREINELHVPVGRNIRLNPGQRGRDPDFFVPASA